MPIVEPDVSLSGKHSLSDAVRININVQSCLFKAMIDHGVYMEGCTLKPNMVHPGKDCPTSYSLDDIAAANICGGGGGGCGDVARVSVAAAAGAPAA